MYSKRVFIRPLAAVMIAATMTACSSSSNESATTTTVEELPKIEVKNVYTQEVNQLAEYTATVEAFKTNNISTSTPNRIKDILVDVGYKVVKGQKLVVLDNVNIDQLKVRIDNMEREYNRAVQLLEIGGGTQQAVDQLKTELDATKRQYDNLVENTVLVSPINGVVTARNYDPGDMTGGAILTIEQMRPVKVLVNVSENEFTKVRKGMKTTIKLDVYGDEEFTGTVTLVHPTINPATRTFTVEIEINNSDERVRPGMFARVQMNFGKADHVVVPDRAVIKQTGSGDRYVYTFKDGVVTFNKVELGQRIDNAYEVLSGVENGDDVVVSGHSRLTNGCKAEILYK